jgi:hypothetical protein
MDGLHLLASTKIGERSNSVCRNMIEFKSTGAKVGFGMTPPPGTVDGLSAPLATAFHADRRCSAGGILSTCFDKLQL